jgi:hypothetical protein
LRSKKKDNIHGLKQHHEIFSISEGYWKLYPYCIFWAHEFKLLSYHVLHNIVFLFVIMIHTSRLSLHLLTS